MKKTIQLVAVCTVIISVLSSCGNNKLRMDLADGSIYSTKMAMSITVNSPLMQGMSGAENIMDFYFDQNVKVNDDETYTITNSFDKFDMNFDGQEMSFDAESTEGNDTIPKEIGDIFKGSFSYTVNNLGKMVGQINFSDFPQGMGESLNLNQMNNSMSLEFPEEDLQVGYTWSVPQEASQSGLEYTIDITYTVKEISDKNVIIEAKGPLSGESFVQGASTNITGNMDGVYTIDRATGWFIGGDYNVDMDLVMNIPVQGEVKMNTSTNIVLTSELK